MCSSDLPFWLTPLKHQLLGRPLQLQTQQKMQRQGAGGAMSSSMIAIMESQVEDMRKSLNGFQVCATSRPKDDAAMQLPQAALPPHADILVFGPSGSGKSSLIRTFYMALHKTQQVPPDFAERIIVKDTAMNEGTSKYVSAVIQPATVDHRGNATSSAIMCHDTRGQIWMDEREQKQLGAMLDGSVKDNVLEIGRASCRERV